MSGAMDADPCPAPVAVMDVEVRRVARMRGGTGGSGLTLTPPLLVRLVSLLS
jgi:hypothetical protein